MLADIMRGGLLIETFTHLSLAITQSQLVALGTLVVFGAHAFVWGTTSTVVRHRAVPDEILGRVGGVYRVAITGGLVIGTPLGGLIARSFGLTAPFWFGFVGSAILVALSVYIRLKLAESPLYARLREQGKASANPVKETYSSGRNWGLMAFALFGATAPEGVVWYTGQFYALIYMLTVLKLDWTEEFALASGVIIGQPSAMASGDRGCASPWSATSR